MGGCCYVCYKKAIQYWFEGKDLNGHFIDKAVAAGNISNVLVFSFDKLVFCI